MAEVTGSAPKLSPPVPLTADHDLSAFDCGEAALNDCCDIRRSRMKAAFRAPMLCVRIIRSRPISASQQAQSSAWPLPAKSGAMRQATSPFQSSGGSPSVAIMQAKGLVLTSSQMPYAVSRLPHKASASALSSSTPRMKRQNDFTCGAPNLLNTPPIAGHCFCRLRRWWPGLVDPRRRIGYARF